MTVITLCKQIAQLFVISSDDASTVSENSQQQEQENSCQRPGDAAITSSEGQVMNVDLEIGGFGFR